MYDIHVKNKYPAISNLRAYKAMGDNEFWYFTPDASAEC